MRALASAIVASLVASPALAASSSSLRGGQMVNWDIVHVNGTVSNAGGSRPLVLVHFEIGKDRAFSAGTLAWDCKSGVTGVRINATTPTRTALDDDHDSLALGYSFDRYALAGSNVWNADAGAVEFCHVLKLILPTPELDVGVDVLEISVDKRRFSFALEGGAAGAEEL